MSGPLWLIDPSVSHAEEQGVREVLAGWNGPSRVFEPVLRPGDGPTGASGYDAAGIVLLGSAVSVHERHDWLDGLAGWLDPLLRGEVRIPLLGVCFGHQLVAHRAGAAVGFLQEDRTKRVGVESSELAGGTLLPGETRLRVVVSHREEVQSVPAGYRCVARRAGVEIDGLEHDELPIFSFQFHPEARDEFALRAGIPADAIDQRLRDDSRMLLDAFLGRVVADAAGE